MKKVIDGFRTTGGKHCITNALKQIFDYYGISLTEELIFGLGEGLDFTYINLANAPMISGRSKVMEFEAILSQHLEAKINFKTGKDYNKILQVTKRMIDANQPVLVYVDMPYLPYLSLNADSHFGGHAVVIFGYDDEQEMFYVSDRDNSDFPIATPKGSIAENYHLVSYTQMQKARTSTARPFPANSKYIAEIRFSNCMDIKAENILSAIAGVCNKMLNPPAKLKGICGIEKFSKEILKWSSFEIEKLKRAGTTNYFQISKDGGTGGGIFRKMYGDFLIESSILLNCHTIREIGLQYISLSARWDKIADSMWQLSVGGDASQLSAVSLEIRALHDLERNLLLDLKSVCEARWHCRHLKTREKDTYSKI